MPQEYNHDKLTALIENARDQLGSLITSSNEPVAATTLAQFAGLDLWLQFNKKSPHDGQKPTVASAAHIPNIPGW